MSPPMLSPSSMTRTVHRVSPCCSTRIGVKAYIVAPEGLKAGDKVMSGENAEPRVGNCMPLRRVPLGMVVHNLEMQPGRGGSNTWRWPPRYFIVTYC